MSRRKSNIGLMWFVISSIAVSIYLIVSRRVNTKKPPNWDVVRQSRFAPLLPYLQAQAKHESGNFTSKLFKETNNMFGMGRPRVRPTTDNKRKKVFTEGNEMASFNCPTDSIRDQLLYLNYMNFPNKVKNPSEFVKLLKDRAYFTDSISNYLEGIKRHMP